MRIAMIGLRGIPAKYSGVETAVEEIGARLAQQGHEVSVYCMSRPTVEAVGWHRGMRLIKIPTVASKNLEMIIYSMLATLHAIFRRYDVIHLHALGPSVMAFVCWVARQPVVVTCHGLDYKREKWGFLARTYLRLGEYVSARYAKQVIAVSKSLQLHFAETYARDISYIPNGSLPQTRVDLAGLSEKYSIERFGYVVFVGRLVECKRVDHLIAAYLQIETPLKLVIVGDGPTSIVANLKSLANRSENIVFTGALHGEELAAVFSNAALFVLPSVLEGLPISLIEALAYDLPVVVSDIPENLEVVSDGHRHRAVVVSSDDRDGLREGLKAAISLVRRSGNTSPGNAEFVSGKYNWDAVSGDTLDVYKRLKLSSKSYRR